MGRAKLASQGRSSSKAVASAVHCSSMKGDRLLQLPDKADKKNLLNVDMEADTQSEDTAASSGESEDTGAEGGLDSCFDVGDEEARVHAEGCLIDIFNGMYTEGPLEAALATRCGAEGKLQQSKPAVFENELGKITFDPFGGPSNCGLLEVICAPGTVTVEDVNVVLTQLSSWFENGVLNKDFVSIFDISLMTTPSVFSVYSLIDEFGKHVASLEGFRIHQQRFGVIRGDSYIFNTLVSAVVTLCGPETPIVFGVDREACLMEFAL